MSNTTFLLLLIFITLVGAWPIVLTLIAVAIVLGALYFLLTVVVHAGKEITKKQNESE